MTNIDVLDITLNIINNNHSKDDIVLVIILLLLYINIYKSTINSLL